MDRELREELRAALLARRRTLAGEVASRAEEGFSLGRDGGQDVADDAATTSARQLLLGLGELERRQLQEIEDALARLDDEEFGLCEECGDEIGAARLRALPHTVLCVECKAIEEQLTRR